MTTRTTTRVGGRAPVDLTSLPALAFVLVLVWIGAQSPDFFTSFNIGNVLTQVTPLLLVATGQTFVIASAGIDLSVGSTASLASVLSAQLFPQLGVPLTIVVAIVASVLVGVVNGWLVSSGLEPFLVTLATLSVVQGIAFTVLPAPGGSVPDSFANVAGYLGSGAIPIALPIAVLVIAAATIFLRRSRTGVNILATGSNASVAQLCGVTTTRAMFWAYGLSGLFAGMAGLFVNARTLGGDPLAGATYTLDSIAAVVLGGTAITGGRASVVGSAFGVVALGLLSNVLNFAHVSNFYQEAAKGVVVILAVGIPIVVVRVSRKIRASGQTRQIQHQQQAITGGCDDAGHDRARTG